MQSVQQSPFSFLLMILKHLPLIGEQVKYFLLIKCKNLGLSRKSQVLCINKLC